MTTSSDVPVLFFSRFVLLVKRRGDTGTWYFEAKVRKLVTQHN
ncbi:MAG TPA: hypothetical protein VHY34_12050 [Caulobacteraceae bacterium]|jgi:hypothetical protein|nr:hypothetical protein [Caulobacteraceae bacterium]